MKDTHKPAQHGKKVAQHKTENAFVPYSYSFSAFIANFHLNYIMNRTIKNFVFLNKNMTELIDSVIQKE